MNIMGKTIRVKYRKHRGNIIHCVVTEQVSCKINTYPTIIEKEVTKYKFEYIELPFIDDSKEAIKAEWEHLQNALDDSFKAIKEIEPYLQNISISKLELQNQDTNELVVIILEQDVPPFLFDDETDADASKVKEIPERFGEPLIKLDLEEIEKTLKDESIPYPSSFGDLVIPF